MKARMYVVEKGVATIEGQQVIVHTLIRRGRMRGTKFIATYRNEDVAVTLAEALNAQIEGEV